VRGYPNRDTIGPRRGRIVSGEGGVGLPLRGYFHPQGYFFFFSPEGGYFHPLRGSSPTIPLRVTPPLRIGIFYSFLFLIPLGFDSNVSLGMMILFI
jgi:hypothetical protein